MDANALQGMTSDKWSKLTPAERQRIAAPAYPEQMAPHLGWRVEVLTHYGETRRFIVGKSTGWRPRYLEIPRVNSAGGPSCDSQGYLSITKIRKVR